MLPQACSGQVEKHWALTKFHNSHQPNLVIMDAKTENCLENTTGRTAHQLGKKEKKTDRQQKGWRLCTTGLQAIGYRLQARKTNFGSSVFFVAGLSEHASTQFRGRLRGAAAVGYSQDPCVLLHKHQSLLLWCLHISPSPSKYLKGWGPVPE